MKLSYYPGCSLESSSKEFDLSARAVCEALWEDLVELPNWICCGASSAHSTNQLLSLALPAQNLALAQKEDYNIAVPCSACYSRLKKADYILRTDPLMCQQIEEIVGFKYTGDIKVLSLLEAIITRVGFNVLENRVKCALKGLKVVCYYGCLLVRPPEINSFDNSENPIMLDRLMKCLGAKVLPWSYKTSCCGASLGLTSPLVAEQLVMRLLNMAERTGAHAIVTTCPLCQSNLELRRKRNNTIPVFYFTELMGLALGIEESHSWLEKHLINPLPLLRSLSLAI